MKYSVLIAALFSLAACNTFEGMGKDLEATGHALTNAADNSKDHVVKAPQPQQVPQENPPQNPPQSSN